MKKNDRNGTCSTHRGQEKCIQSFGRETGKNELPASTAVGMHAA